MTALYKMFLSCIDKHFQLICFNNVNCLLNDNDKKSSDLCTVRPQGYQPPFHSMSGQCLLI